MLSEILGSAVRSLSSNRLRSSLSVLGIVIGTFAIVFVNAIGNGVETFVRDRLGFLSATSVFVEPATSGFVPSKLKEEDLEKLLARSEYLSGGTVMSIGKANVGVPGKSEAYMLLGTDGSFLESMKFSIGSGRFFTDTETRETAKVVVVGRAMAEKFYPGRDPLGESLSIGKTKFRIIGVLADAPSLSGMSFNDIAYLPFTSSKRFVIGEGSTTLALALLARDVESVPKASEETKRILRKIHGLSDAEPDDFNVFEQKAMVGAISMVTKALTYLLTGVAALILAVSGIGIMNVMYASVAERRKDVGILRAVGASKRDVAYRFLAESVILGLFGAGIGIALSEAAIVLTNRFSTDFTLVRGNSGDFIALGFTVAIAAFFGMYPAMRAADLDPVDALR